MKIAAAFACLLGACGGSVSNTPTPQPLSVSPSPATLFSGLPTTFFVSGGTGAYIVVSSDQQIVPVAGTSGSNFTVIPGQVTTDTPVTLTVRNAGSAVTDSVTVKPTTLNSTIIIQPTETACTRGVCSGGDALVTAAFSTPRWNVEFSIVSGDAAWIASDGSLVPAETVAADASGAAQARLRALPVAPTQTAILQAKDVATGSFRRASFQIIQTTAASFITLPTVISFSGATTNECASQGAADVHIFGGTPPYTIGQSVAVAVSTTTVSASGGGFTVQPRGLCGSFTIPITDAAGRTGSVTVSVIAGTANPPPLQAAPNNVTLGNCASRADVSVIGGNGAYAASSSDASAVSATQNSPHTVTIGRVSPSTATTDSTVSIQSGNAIVTVGVQVPVSALTCP